MVWSARVWRWPAWQPLAIALTLAGCSKGSPKAASVELVPVGGVVTSRGVPAPNVAVVFVPSDSRKPVARGLTDARGRYVLQYKGKAAGIEPGDYKVVFLFVGPRPADFATAARPPDFSDPEKTPYVASVGAAGAIHNFDLTKAPLRAP